VERATEHNHVLLARRNACQFDRALYRFRPRIAEEESIHRRRHDFAQFFDQSQHGLMNDDICLRVEKESRLLADRFNDFRMAVTCVGHANPTSEVKKSFAVSGVNV
jgi:hypothetical protein